MFIAFPLVLILETSASVDSRARFALAGPSVCEGSRLKDGRSDKASSDTEDSRESGLANNAPGPEVRLTPEFGKEGRSNALARDDVDNELDGRLRA
jgi:hypothetical protein